MAHFQLEKGGKFTLDKGIKNVQAGMGWTADDMDLDASAFGLAHIAGGKAVLFGDGSHAAFYGNSDIKQANGSFVTKDGSITHTGDSRQGGAVGDPDEVIYVDLDKIPRDLVEIAFWVTIYHAHAKQQTFGGVKNAYIKLVDRDTNSVLCEYKLGAEFSAATAVQVGSMVRNDAGNWEFAAVGAGAPVEIDAILGQYGG